MKNAKTLIVGTALSAGMVGAVTVNAESNEFVAEQIETAYVRELGCAAIDVTFSTSLTDMDTDPDHGLVRMAKAVPGQVSLSFHLLDVSQRELMDVVAHELTHACAGPERRFDNVFETSRGDKLIGSQGFRILAENPDKNPKERSFNLIEEGVAMVLQERVVGPNPESHVFYGYTALQQLTRDLQEKHRISDHQLAQMVQTSDLLSFVAIVSGQKSAKTVGLRELAYVMQMYDDVYQKALDTAAESISSRTD